MTVVRDWPPENVRLGFRQFRSYENGLCGESTPCLRPDAGALLGCRPLRARRPAMHGPACPPPLLASLLGVLQAFLIVLTQPSFCNLRVVVCGWLVSIRRTASERAGLLTQGQHAVTEALVMTGVAGRRYHAAFIASSRALGGSPTSWAAGCSGGCCRSSPKARSGR